jgi:hypothetical protein
MSSKRIELFEKASNHFKKKFSENILTIATHFKKKTRFLKKKSLVAIAALPQWPVRPGSYIVFPKVY